MGQNPVLLMVKASVFIMVYRPPLLDLIFHYFSEHLLLFAPAILNSFLFLEHSGLTPVLGSCTICSLCLKCSPTDVHRINVLISFKLLFKWYFLNEVYPDYSKLFLAPLTIYTCCSSLLGSTFYFF